MTDNITETAVTTAPPLTPSTPEPMREISIEDMYKEMGTGWNLGNSFDSHPENTSFGNPISTTAMIDAVYEGGFRTLRVPITWYKRMGNAPEYTIAPTYFDDIEVIVNHALKLGMYVIINTHHETSWMLPLKADLPKVTKQFTRLWEQVCKRFENYGDRLVFEGMNEPRVPKTPEEWSGGTAEVRECINELNQTFIDTVRASGGNNAKRLILITTEAASPYGPANQGFVYPKDVKLGISLHAYTPFDFTYENKVKFDTWEDKNNGDLDVLFKAYKEMYIDKGLPVIVTEYGAVSKQNHAEVAKWVTEYLKRAKELNIPCIWWDNGTYLSAGEKFALYDRKENKWFRTEVKDAIMAVYK